MITTVLMHGALQDRDCWEAVQGFLEVGSSRVLAVSLSAESSMISARDQARHVVGQLPAGAEPFLLVTHGTAIGLIPELSLMCDTQAVVAVSPIPTYAPAVEARTPTASLRPGWLEGLSHWNEPIARSLLAEHFLFHDVPAALSKLIRTRPLLPPITDSANDMATNLRSCVLRWFVVGEYDRVAYASWQRKTYRGPQSPVLTVPAGHCPHLSLPRETAHIILEAAEYWMRRQPDAVDQDGLEYEGYMAQTAERRQLLLSRMNPDQRLILLQTQISRWLAWNRCRLSSEQVQLLQDTVSEIGVSFYDSAKRSEVAERKRDLMSRLLGTLALEDLRDIASLFSSYLPRPQPQL